MGRRKREYRLAVAEGTASPYRTELRRKEAAKRNYINLMPSKQLIEDYLFLQAYSVVRERH